MATTPDFDLATDRSDLLDAIRDITPDVTFDQSFEQSHFLLCEHHNHTDHEIDAIRKTITDTNYWKYEALFLKSLLSDVIFDNINESIQKVDQGESKRWQRIANAYNHRLHRQGIKKTKIASQRLTIKKQEYWEPEAELLRKYALQKESAWRDANLVSAFTDKIGFKIKDRHVKRLQQKRETRRPRLALKSASRRTGLRSSDKLGG